jgi:hypothetical protein
LPFVHPQQQTHQLQWWGDADATVAYCQETVDRICRDFGGDRCALILAGFSRGAIACNYIGLHDDAIAGLWLAFVAHSHYDGVRKWPYVDSDRPSALQRLERLRGRPQFISHETSVAETRDYLQQSGVMGDFTFVSLPFPNHTDSWVLRDLPERQQLRQWVDDILSRRKRTDLDVRP